MVDGLADRLAHGRIGERRLLVVEAQRELAVRRALVDHIVGVVLERTDELGLDAGEDVEVAGGERVDLGVRIGEVLERDAADRRLGAPVVVVALEGDRGADRPVGELEGAGAVGGVLEARGVGLQHGPRPTRQSVREVVVPRVELDDHRRVVGGIDADDAGEAGRLVGALGPLGIEGPLHVGGRQRLAALELHPVVEGEGVRRPVGADLRELGQTGCDGAFVVGLEQGLVDVVEQHLVEGGASDLDDVEAGRLEPGAHGDLHVGVGAVGGIRRRGAGRGARRRGRRAGGRGGRAVVVVAAGGHRQSADEQEPGEAAAPSGLGGAAEHGGHPT